MLAEPVSNPFKFRIHLPTYLFRICRNRSFKVHYVQLEPEDLFHLEPQCQDNLYDLE
jgi:hypothetical protein